jgi:DNA helicase-2/ATP-dependent DNA helicase PcrA
LIERLITQSRELNLVELLDLVIGESGYKEYISGLVDSEERWENMLELRAVAQEYRDLQMPDALSIFLESIALVSDVDGIDSTTDSVTLITLHQAKGLEYPVVFIVGMEEGILPHYRSLDDAGQMEEERRLCYVGITRAKHRIYLVRAFRRNLMGNSTVNMPSRFLEDIPSRLISGGARWRGEDTQIAQAMYAWNKTPMEKPVMVELSAGDHVHHSEFGNGLVVGYQPVKDDAEVMVAFDGIGLKKLLLSFAKLEKL